MTVDRNSRDYVEDQLAYFQEMCRQVSERLPQLTRDRDGLRWLLEKTTEELARQEGILASHLESQKRYAGRCGRYGARLSAFEVHEFPEQDT